MRVTFRILQMQGACGYGLLSESTYPYWTVAALSPENQFYQAGPSGGCGQCFEVMCMNEGGPNAVNLWR